MNKTKDNKDKDGDAGLEGLGAHLLIYGGVIMEYVYAAMILHEAKKEITEAN